MTDVESLYIQVKARRTFEVIAKIIGANVAWLTSQASKPKTTPFNITTTTTSRGADLTQRDPVKGTPL